ncbi:Chromatin modification- protein meaf6 [Actinomortierella ambigua]|uniref:Chromatin modification-related protein EAF6 n=1 Tax=Actinomortierella ambigua TaxID=1343610 RepID=A0A9P6QK76_9FUNG|nr:Chromatin modification- protein meaf6 [Actinomortierella ambigua]KAG0267644.1 Chromatin modification- protein meaf6 [Actinomortierella ambigua]
MPDASEVKEKEKVTHQMYLEAKNELNELIARKKLVDRNLASLENSIYAFEGSYLEDTLHGGNIIRGFDGYLNPKADKSRQKYSESDRLFSMSSTTFTKALQIKDNPDQESSDEGKRSSSKRPSNRPTPVPTPASTPSSSSNRRLLKQQQKSSSSSSKNLDNRPSKKLRMSSGRENDDEDLDV